MRSTSVSTFHASPTGTPTVHSLRDSISSGPLEHPSCGTNFHPGANFQMGHDAAAALAGGPTLGQDNEYVYKDLLGVTDD